MAKSRKISPLQEDIDKIADLANDFSQVSDKQQKQRLIDQSLSLITEDKFKQLARYATGQKALEQIMDISLQAERLNLKFPEALSAVIREDILIQIMPRAPETFKKLIMSIEEVKNTEVKHGLMEKLLSAVTAPVLTATVKSTPEVLALLIQSLDNIEGTDTKRKYIKALAEVANSSILSTMAIHAPEELKQLMRLVDQIEDETVKNSFIRRLPRSYQSEWELITNPVDEIVAASKDPVSLPPADDPLVTAPDQSQQPLDENPALVSDEEDTAYEEEVFDDEEESPDVEDLEMEELEDYGDSDKYIKSQFHIRVQLTRYLIKNGMDENEANSLATGMCHGLAICHAAMHAVNKLEWWEALIYKLSAWKGSEKELNQKFELPGGEQPIALKEMFEKAINFMLYNHADKRKAVFMEGFIPTGMTQGTILKPDSRLIEGKTKEEDKKQSFFEIDEKIKNKEGKDELITHSIKSHISIGTNLSKEAFKCLIDEDLAKSDICLVSSSAHTIRVAYKSIPGCADPQWLVYDPNYSLEDATRPIYQVFPNSRGKNDGYEKMMTEVMSILQKDGNDLIVEAASFNPHKSYASTSEKLAQEDHRKLVEANGLRLLAGSSPTTTLMSIVQKKENWHNAEFLNAFIEGLKNKDPYNQTNLFHIVAKAPAALTEVINRIDASVLGKKLQSELFKLLDANCRDGDTFLDVLMCRPEILAGLIKTVEGVRNPAQKEELIIKLLASIMPDKLSQVAKFTPEALFLLMKSINEHPKLRDDQKLIAELVKAATMVGKDGATALDAMGDSAHKAVVQFLELVKNNTGFRENNTRANLDKHLALLKPYQESVKHLLREEQAKNDKAAASQNKPSEKSHTETRTKVHGINEHGKVVAVTKHQTGHIEAKAPASLPRPGIKVASSQAPALISLKA